MSYNVFVENQDILVPVLSLRKIFIFWFLYDLYQLIKRTFIFELKICYIRNMYMLVLVKVIPGEAGFRTDCFKI